MAYKRIHRGDVLLAWLNSFKQCALVIGLLAASIACFGQTKPPLPEVSILIDTSGSMAENDADNIRQPALRMLAKILPKGAMAGVWIFDTTAQSIVPMGKVDRNWVEEAQVASAEIHSEGFYTNLNDALEKAALPWSEPDFEAKRNIILLTDGIMDVSENSWENEEAKAHLLKTIIPRLQALRVHVHTIALSDQADAKLLDRIALETDGLFAKIQNSEELQRVFLQLFERSFKKNALPIEENKFVVDESVEEITMLVFRKSKTENLKLKKPNKKVFYKFSYPKNVHWFREGVVDMITITKPEPGTWALIGNVDPDNRVLVISDLGLDMSSLPANIFAGEEFLLTTTITEQGKPLNAKKLLDFIQLEMSVETQGQEKETLMLNDEGLEHDALADDGIFTTKLGPVKHIEAPQDTKVTVALKSKTFQRQVTQRVKLLPTPIAVETVTSVSKTGKILMSIDVRPNFEVLKLGTVDIEAVTKDDTGHISKYKVKKANEELWRLELTPKSNIGQYETKFKITGQTKAGRAIELNTEPVIFAVPEVTLPKVEDIAQSSAEKDKQPKQSKASMVRVMLIAILIIMVNVAIVGLGVVLYQKIRKGRQAKLNKLTDALFEPVQMDANETADNEESESSAEQTEKESLEGEDKAEQSIDKDEIEDDAKARKDGT